MQLAGVASIVETVGRVSALTLTYGNRGEQRSSENDIVVHGPAHGLPFYAGHAAAARQDWISRPGVSICR